MAELLTEPSGLRRIRFYDADEKRQSIRIGRMSLKRARNLKMRVEELIEASITGDALNKSTAEWVNELESKLRQKLERVGLLKTRKRSSVKLIERVDEYIASRSDAKLSTITVYGHTRRNLADHS